MRESKSLRRRLSQWQRRRGGDGGLRDRDLDLADWTAAGWMPWQCKWLDQDGIEDRYLSSQRSHQYQYSREIWVAAQTSAGEMGRCACSRGARLADERSQKSMAAGAQPDREKGGK